MKTPRTFNPQKTQNGAQLNKVSRGMEATPRQILMGKKTATNPQVTITPRMLNSIKAAPKGQLPAPLKRYAKPMLPMAKKAKMMPKKGTF